MNARYEATGTWNIQGPINLWSYATYRLKDGTTLRAPVGVAGDRITGTISNPTHDYSQP